MLPLGGPVDPDELIDPSVAPPRAPLVSWLLLHRDELERWTPGFVAAAMILLLAGLGGGNDSFNLALGLEGVLLGAWAAGQAIKANKMGADIAEATRRLLQADVARQVRPVFRALSRLEAAFPSPLPASYVLPDETARHHLEQLFDATVACTVDLPAALNVRHMLSSLLRSGFYWRSPPSPAELLEAVGRASDEAINVLLDPDRATYSSDEFG